MGLFSCLRPSDKSRDVEDIARKIEEIQTQLSTFQENALGRESKVGETVMYPAAELLAQACYEDYKNELDSYNRIYDKVNILLAFVGVVLVVFIDRIDFSYLPGLFGTTSCWYNVVMLFSFMLSLASTFLAIYSTIKLLELIAGRRIIQFNSIEFRNEKRYEFPVDAAALALIEAYTNCTMELRKIIKKKQQEFDTVTSVMGGAVLCYSLSVLFQKLGAII